MVEGTADGSRPCGTCGEPVAAGQALDAVLMPEKVTPTTPDTAALPPLRIGLVRGGASARLRPLLQPGNSVTAVWRARLDEHLGYYQVDGTRLRAAALLASSHAVYGVTHLASLARLLPERDPHEDIFEMLERMLDDFDDVADRKGAAGEEKRGYGKD